MKNLLVYFVAPPIVVLFHYAYFRFISRLSVPRRFLGVVNLVFYPVVASLLVCVLFLVLVPGLKANIPFAVVGGFLFALASICFSLLPMISPIFQEVDIQFFMISFGSVLGMHVEGRSPWKDFVNLVEGHFSSFVVLFVVVALLTTILKYYALKGLGDLRDGEIRGSIIWTVSITCGVASVPVIYFFFNMGGAR